MLHGEIATDDDVGQTMEKLKRYEEEMVNLIDASVIELNHILAKPSNEAM